MKKFKKQVRKSLSKAFFKFKYGDNQFIGVKLDKNYQVAEITPIIPATRSILNDFRGRPFTLCKEELTERIKSLISTLEG